MRHHVRISAAVPSYHRHFDRATIANAYHPRLHQSLCNWSLSAQVQWLDGGGVELAVAYEADLEAEQGHHLSWLNATLQAAQQAGLQVTEAYVTRSISMALFGGGAGAAGGYRASGAAGAFVLAVVGLVVGSFFRTHIPIYKVEYSPIYGWQLVPIQQLNLRTLQFRLA